MGFPAANRAKQAAEKLIVVKGTAFRPYILLRYQIQGFSPGGGASNSNPRD